MIGLRRQRLQHRIVLSVVLGLSVILLLFGLVAFWTIQQSIQAAYAERVTLAEVLAQRATDVFSYELALLEHEAGEPEHVAANLHPAVGVPPSEALQGLLADLRLEMGTPAVLSLTDAAGNAIWTEPERPDIVIGRPLLHPSVQMVLANGRPHVAHQHADQAPPLRDEQGRLIGVLMAEVDPGNEALNLMPSADVGTGMHAQLVDVAGTVL